MHFDYFHPIPLGPTDCAGNGQVDSVVGSRTGSIPSSNGLTYWGLSVHGPCNPKLDCPGRSRAIYRTGDRSRGGCWSSVMRAGCVVQGSSYPGSEDFVRQLGFDFGTVAVDEVAVVVAAVDHT